jgi:peroxiredoxin
MKDKGLPPGTLAPDFTLTASDGTTVRLSDLRGGWIALYFLRGTW